MGPGQEWGPELGWLNRDLNPKASSKPPTEQPATSSISPSASQHPSLGRNTVTPPV